MKFFTKRNIYITLFAILYATVALVSLIHSFSFFGLANNSAMSIMLGTAFEIGQAAVLFAILTSSKDRGRIMPWALMILLTLVQIIGNVFSSYKYLMMNNVADLHFFKEPIFVWTDLPDNVTTVLVTYIVGAILPIVALCMTSMIANYLEDNTVNEDNSIKQVNDDNDIPKEIENVDENVTEEKNQSTEEQKEQDIELIDDKVIEEGNNEVIEETNEEKEIEKQSHFVNI